MAADGGDSATFVVRLVDQVMGPARSIKASMGGIDKAFKSTQKAMSAPISKHGTMGAMSTWDKTLAKAKLSQAKDFGAQHARAVKAGQDQEGGGLSGMLGGLAPAVLSGGIAGAVAAGLGAVFGLVKQAASAVVGLGESFAAASVEGAMFAEKSTLAISYLTDKGLPEAGRQFDDVRHMAQSLGLGVDETVGSFERLLAMQFSVGKSKDLIKMAGDMRAIGASADEVQRILYAISEIKSMGTLQKRQERMLQMAGISGTLIDEALMKKTGIHDKGKLDKARAHNKIGADVAVEAVLDAVMHKTHESQLGEVGTKRADTTLSGMWDKFGAGVKNFFIDVGDLVLPGLTKVVGLVQGTMAKLMGDPNITGIGDFMLAQFETFVGWVQVNWPIIELVITGAIYAVGAGLKFVASLFDDTTLAGQSFQGLLMLLAVVFGLLVIAVAMILAPIYAAVAAIGWLISKFVELVEWLGMVSVGSGSTGANLAIGGPANDNGIQGVTAAGGVQALNGAGVTMAGLPPVGAPVHIGELNVHTAQSDDPQKQAHLIDEAVHSAMAKVMRQAAG